MSTEYRHRVAIVHPWFPQYRAPFFETLIPRAAELSIKLEIFHGDPPPEWEERGDSVQRDYAQRLPTRFVSLAGKSLGWKQPGPVGRRGQYDLVVLEQAVRNLETYYLLPRLGRARVAFWGHGKSYTLRTSYAQESAKRWMTNRGSWFFAYTHGGASAVVDGGFPASRVTVVNNSIDTTALSRALNKVSSRDRQVFCADHDLRGRTAIFIGGLDGAKRLDFLLDAARIVANSDPDFRLVIAGDGNLRGWIEAACESLPFIRYVGPLHGQDKAIALASAQCFAMPGRVGLIAVDSFVSGLPVVTTRWPFHAPEFEYLTPNEDSIVTEDSTVAYAAGLQRLLSSPDTLRAMSHAAREKSSQYTVSTMAENFATGLVRALR